MAGSFLNTMAKGALRVAATADLHYAKHSRGKMHDAFAEISRSADVLLSAAISRSMDSPRKRRNWRQMFAAP